MNQEELAMRLFNKMRASKVAPDSVIYEVLIEYLSGNLCIDDATNLLDEMVNSNLTPPDHLYVGIVNGFCILEKFGEAKKFLEDRKVTKTDSNNALLKHYCLVGNFLEAKGLFDQMVERNIADSFSWNMVIKFFVENGRTNMAFQYLGRMIVSSWIPDSAIYSAIVVEKCKSNELEFALELFHQVCSKCWILDSSSYAILVECLCQMKKIQEAVKVFCYMSTKKCTLKSSSFDMLIKGLCLRGQVDRAITLLPLAYCSNTYCSSAGYNTILLGLSKLKKVNSLLVTVSRMVVKGCILDVETYNILIRSLSEFRRTSYCALFLNLMVNEGLLPNSETLVDVLSCLAKHSQLYMISVTIDKLVSEHEILNPAMYNTLIKGLWKEGYRNEACRLLDVMLENGWVPDSTTHGILIGSVEIKSKENDVSASEKVNMQDEVSSILSEGFRER